MGFGGMMGLSNGMIPVQGPGAQVPSMVPIGMPPGGPQHMQGAHPAPRCRTSRLHSSHTVC